MVSGIIFDNDEKERHLLTKLVKDGIALRVDDESSVVECEDKNVFLKAIKDADLNDFCCMEFAAEGGKNNVSALRKSFPSSALLLLVDMAVSPKEYVRPDIMPSAIVFKPSDEDNLTETLTEFLDSVLKPDDNDDSSISIDTREGVTRIPYEQIFYVEASSKKVFIRTRKEEYGYYDTLDNLESILPEYFERCHRGFIVNTHKVKKYVGSENTLYLNDGSMIPVSRSYKGTIREVLK